ncbi:hypothetical protein [Elizabethkingia anophelis]|uniref:hypothetical protein n=1 Tax=Elizabethkingia anophelis TaxID=1117645 RepID=UPI000DD5F740|nr:hypothetical protein [Elizabethkingia anophelis]MDC8024875.1 hypothetical protein [Elizabethkingia anophelis]RBA36145.1 hypothetical protein DSC50_02015 [Elizabethkingia anophelis]
MEGKELRIGNYLHDRNGNLCKVIELREDGIYAPAINEAITGLLNKPIELTEEWLLKLGFNKSKFSSNCFKITNGYKFDFAGGEVLYLDSIMQEHIKYIHQLQNLYFALTGEELILQNDGK